MLRQKIMGVLMAMAVIGTMAIGTAAEAAPGYQQRPPRQEYRHPAPPAKHHHDRYRHGPEHRHVHVCRYCNERLDGRMHRHHRHIHACRYCGRKWKS